LFKELHRPSELEVMFDVVIGSAKHLYAKLVQGVIVALAHPQRKPCIAPLHQALKATTLGQLAIGFLLGEIFYLEQHALPL
jgi:hypothetical protein